MKIKAAEQIGISASCLKLERSISQMNLLNKIKELNESPDIHGIIVQMPLDSEQSIDSHLVTDSVSPAKDVDGLNTVNEGRIATGDLETGYLPCTPNGCLALIRRSGVEIAGARAVVLGRSKIVGTPMAELLKWHHATVTVCHSKYGTNRRIISVKFDNIVNQDKKSGGNLSVCGHPGCCYRKGRDGEG